MVAAAAEEDAEEDRSDAEEEDEEDGVHAVDAAEDGLDAAEEDAEEDAEQSKELIMHMLSVLNAPDTKLQWHYAEIISTKKMHTNVLTTDTINTGAQRKKTFVKERKHNARKLLKEQTNKDVNDINK